MLRELTKVDWLTMLDIPADRVPEALILRGTRNLQVQYDRHRGLFENVLDVGSPNVLIEQVLIGERNGRTIAYASVYGAPMASEIVHLFGVLGTRLVLQTGCCGAWGDDVRAGDFFVPTRACCGEGASQYYREPSDDGVCTPTLDVSSFVRGLPIPVHTGGIFTTSALFAEGTDELTLWRDDGWDAVDMETATTFAVAKHFGMEAASLLFVFDNPLHVGDIVHTNDELDDRRKRGDDAMVDTAFDIIEHHLTS